MNTKYEILYQELKNNIIDLLNEGIGMLPPERDIALSHGVSRQTVRQALSLLEKDNLIRRVQGGGSHLTGIRPDRYNNRIAMVLSAADEYIFPRLVSALKVLLEQAGFELDVYETDSSYNTERKVLQDISAKGYIAVVAEPISCARPTPNADIYERIMSDRVPVIFLFGYYPNVRNSLYIKDDNYAGGHELGEYLLSLSHTKIAGLFQADTLRGYERFLGLSKSLIEAGIPISDDKMLWFSNEQLYNLEKKQDTRFLDEFIKKDLMSCSAVICYNDIIAYWLIRELSIVGINVPQDISVVSFDNSYLSDLSRVRISGMTHPKNQISETIFSLITDCLTGKEATPVILPWSFVDKGSCADLT